ncbi:MAG: inverse autotransporter beta domain-containing protein [Candidatus Adiutrix intracellularis]|nr:inverse autotransporter beta domain-containing protein [Candidatus Adiutrix intracellularis]
MGYVFTCFHSRRGIDVEDWYDWLRVVVNYYTSLSGWKNSKIMIRLWLRKR